MVEQGRTGLFPMNRHAEKPFRLGLAGLLAAALLLFLGGCLVRHVLLTAFFPYPVEYGEGVTVNWLLRIREGLPLYPVMTAESLPWLHNPYGPLWFHLVRWIPEVGDGVFTAARLTSVLGLILSLILLYRLTRRDLSPMGAAALCALFGASPLVWRYAVMARVDMTALALSLAAVWLMEKESPAGDGKFESPNPKSQTGKGTNRIAECWPWLAAGGLAAAAILVKPLFLAAALAGLTTGFLRGRRPGVAFATGVALPLLVCLAWIFAAGETAIFTHFGPMNHVGASFPLMARLAAVTAGHHPFLLAALAYGLLTVDRRTPRWWFALFTMASLASSAKIGADAHYYLAPLAAGVLMAGSALAGLAGQRHHGMLTWCLAAQLALYLPVMPRPVFTATYGQEVPSGQTALTPGEADRELGQRLTQEMAGAMGTILADDPGYLLAAGKKLQVQPFQYGWLVRRGRLNPAPLLKQVDHEHFTLVMLRISQTNGPSGSDFPQEVIRAVEEKYELLREIGPYRLFVPRLVPDDAQIEL
jgi:hypothetical protein